MSQQRRPGPEEDDREVIRPIPFEPPGARRRVARLPLRSIGVAASVLVLLALVLVAVFVITSRSLSITVQPEPDSLRIEGGIVVPLGERFLARPGSYRLHAGAEGYHPLNETLTVTGQHDQRFEFRLRPLPGHLRVEAGPMATARVYLDGEEQGNTPITLRSLEAGEHSVRAEAARYRPAERELTIEGRGIEQQLRFELEPAWAEVSIASSPPGATLSIDGEAAGSTPLTHEVLEGRRRFELQLEGHKSWRQEIDVTAGEPLDLGTIDLPLADATLKVLTEPAGANITIDGEFRGQSPFSFSARPGATVRVQAYKPGYEKRARSVDVKRGEQQVRLELEPRLGEVMVLSLPEDARLYVDGEPRGKAVQILRLPARPHRIELRREGYQPYSTTVTPRPGVQQRIEARLLSKEQARRARIEDRIRTAAGQELKLFRPDSRFTMGAPRREPGRRANEVQRDVRLTRPFYLSLREVTNAQFKKFLSSHSSGRAGPHSLDGSKQPVARVSWEQAAKYCNWLSEQDGLQPFYQLEGGAVAGADEQANGYRLPTEAEWVWAARVRPDGSLRKFPWGDEMPPSRDSGNYADLSARDVVGEVLRNYSDDYPVSAPVGSLLANEKGVFDLGGNVAEWVHDIYDIAMPAQGVTLTDPTGPENGDSHVIRGSSWAHAGITELRLSYRDNGSEGREDLGFRIARYLE